MTEKQAAVEAFDDHVSTSSDVGDRLLPAIIAADADEMLWQHRAEAAEAECARLREALSEIGAIEGEINPSNYDHDDACFLNKQFVYAITVADNALGSASPCS